MTIEKRIRFDWQRSSRTGLPEVVFAQGKSLPQLISIVEQSQRKSQPLFMTRLEAKTADSLSQRFGEFVTYYAEACCLSANWENRHLSPDAKSPSDVAIVAAGTCDSPVVAEIEHSLNFLGHSADCFVDVGVAGLWRLLECLEDLQAYPVLIAVAGMEGALFSVLAGLVDSPVIAVPSSVGYGVSAGGHAALHSALASCAPGLAVVNIDNGFGAAALAAKMLRSTAKTQTLSSIEL
ncbi:MAG: nickel pincer cofactor biosynthesis protein LarB [Granulosicoccus sp.]